MDGEDGVSFISPLGILYTPALKGIPSARPVLPPRQNLRAPALGPRYEGTITGPSQASLPTACLGMFSGSQEVWPDTDMQAEDFQAGPS